VANLELPRRAERSILTRIREIAAFATTPTIDERESMASLPPFDVKDADDDSHLVSQGIRAVVEAPCALGPQLTWDGYVRLVYYRMNEGIQRQANTLLMRGNISAAEARALVESQRNGLLKALRDRSSPFARMYAEFRKPSSSLPTLESLVKRKGSIEAVLKSVGKANRVVDRMGIVMRMAGPATIVLQITMTAVVIGAAPREQRGRVAAREVGSGVGGASFGAGGAWAGCASAAMLLSPSLFVPVVGEGVEAGACLVGGIIGGLGAGYVGNRLGREAGENVYDLFTTQYTWL
jgi:hypothetical protein